MSKNIFNSTNHKPQHPKEKNEHHFNLALLDIVQYIMVQDSKIT